MLFSWDEDKRRENWELRKVDLLEAALIFEDPEVIEKILRHLGLEEGERPAGEALPRGPPQSLGLFE